MPLTPQAALRRISTSIAFRVRGELAPLLEQHKSDLAARLDGAERRLAAIEDRLHELEALESLEAIEALRARLEAIEGALGALERLSPLQSELAELRRLAESGLELEGEKTELFGRLLRTATSRLDRLEERPVGEP